MAKFQVVLGDYSFTDVPIVEEMLTNWSLIGAGFKYHTVSILGGQSSGKSTLLNRLFGTDFDELDSSTGIHQTTRGIWLSHSSGNGDPVLVLDVEGSDSVERGSEYHTFERRAALFSMALSEVLIVNLWETEVGRQSAVHSSVIRVVMDSFLRQFYHPSSPKTMLLFVIRDQYQSKLPLLKTKLLSEMEEIWTSIDKSSEQASLKASDCFTFEVVGLPHLKFQKEEFDEAATSLAARFKDPHSDQYLFQEELHKRNPADGFASYAASIWSAVMSDKDLDIPSQKRIHGYYRCEKIRQELLEKFHSKLSTAKIEDLSSFKSFADQVRNETIESFTTLGSRYDKVPFEENLEGISSVVNDSLMKVYSKIAKTSAHTLLYDLQQKLSNYKGSRALICESFRVLKQLCYQARGSFEQALTASLPNGVQEIDEVVLAELASSIEAELAIVREDQIRVWKQVVNDKIRNAYVKSLDLVFEKLEISVWTAAGTTLASVIESIQKETEVKGFDLGSSNAEMLDWTSEFQNSLAVTLREKLENKKQLLPIIMKRRFDQAFRYDENRVPRTWTPDLDVGKLYANALQQGLVLLNVFARPDDSFSLNGEPIFSLTSDETEGLKDHLEQAATVMYQEALTVQQSLVKPATIPPWIFVLLFILGLNEGIALLSAMIYSPFVLTGVCFLVGSLYVLHGMGQLGVVQTVATALFVQASEMAVSKLSKLRGNTNQPEAST